MKPFDKFLGQMMEAAQLTQDKNPHAATQLIQQALAAAGLVPGQTSTGAGRAVPDLVDLNPLPDWLQKAGAHADTYPDEVQRVIRNLPGRKRSRKPTQDPRAPGEFLQGTYTSAAGQRDYKLYVPSTPAAGPRPLLVMLHGCTQDPDDFAAGTAMNILAEAHGCLVLYPEQPRSANATLCWNWFEAAHQEREGGEPALIAGMTREVIERWQGNPARVYVAGLSAGGAMAAIMGAAYPDLYAAVGVHSGLPVGKARDLITGLAAMKKAPAGRGRGRAAGRVRQHVPVIVFHGDSDGTVHPDNGAAVLEQFLRPAQGSSDATLRRVKEGGEDLGYTRTAILDRADRSVAEYWELHGAGHAWSGGSAAGSYTSTAGPDASAEMLRFFLNQAIQ